MPSDILMKRQLVKDAYNGSPKWTAKVDKMTDEQIIAVYFRLKQQNQI